MKNISPQQHQSSGEDLSCEAPDIVGYPTVNGVYLNKNYVRSFVAKLAVPFGSMNFNVHISDDDAKQLNVSFTWPEEFFQVENGFNDDDTGEIAYLLRTSAASTLREQNLSMKDKPRTMLSFYAPFPLNEESLSVQNLRLNDTSPTYGLLIRAVASSSFLRAQKQLKPF